MSIVSLPLFDIRSPSDRPGPSEERRSPPHVVPWNRRCYNALTMIVDFHTHILPPDFSSRRERLRDQDATFGDLFADPKAKLATVEELVEVMDAQGVDVAVVLGFGWCDQGVAREANDYLLEAAARFPERLVAFCSVNPAWGQAAVAEVDRCARQGARGVGELHSHTQGFRLGDRAALQPLMEVAQAHRMTVVVHGSEPVGHSYPGKGDATPQALLQLVEQFPDTPIVCAHWGGGLPFYALMPEVAQALANTYFDTAASPFLYEPRVFSIATQLVGVHRILFGSDYPLIQPERLLRQVEEAMPSPEDRQRMLGGNAARLLGLADR